MNVVGKRVLDWLAFMWQNDSYYSLRFINIFYALILCFWGPIYVAAGFGLYINARTLAEAWDIQLRFRQMAQRLGRQTWLLLLLPLLCLGFATSPEVRAETLPNREAAVQTQKQVLEDSPFPEIKTKNRLCWNKCDAPMAIGDISISRNSDLLNAILKLLVVVLVAVVAFLLWRWLSQRISATKNNQLEPLPDQLFGLDLTEKAWPADVVAEARRLWPQQFRAAMALLYGGSLREAHKNYALPLRDSDTEQEILRRVRNQCNSNLHAFWPLLTQAWILSAYAHRLPENTLFDDLCRQYRTLFAGTKSS